MSTANAQCVTTSWDAATSQRVYTVTSVWAPGGCWGDVLISANDFQAVVDAAGGSSGSGSSPFTTEEITALKNQAANPSVLNLSPSEGSLVGGAIVLTWAAAWVFKALTRALNVDGDFEK